MDAAELVRARQAAIRQCVGAGAPPHDAEDHAHDALVALLEQQPAPVGVQAWVATVARRRHVDLVRRSVRERAAVARLAARPPADDADPQQTVPDRDQAAWLVQALNTLPPATQAVCRAAARGLAVPDIARVLGLSVRSVQSHLTRARRHVRRLAVLVVVGLAFAYHRCLRAMAQLWPVEAAAAFAVPAAALLVLAPGTDRPVPPGTASHPHFVADPMPSLTPLPPSVGSLPPRGHDRSTIERPEPSAPALRRPGEPPATVDVSAPPPETAVRVPPAVDMLLPVIEPPPIPGPPVTQPATPPVTASIAGR